MSPNPIDDHEGLHIVQDGNVSWINRRPPLKAPMRSDEIEAATDAELVDYIRRKDAEFMRHREPPDGFGRAMAMACLALGAVVIAAGIWGLMGCPGLDGLSK